MAKEDTKIEGEVKMHGNFVKKTSFERNVANVDNPDNEQPKVNVNFDVSHELFDKKSNTYHVNIKVNADASVKDTKLFDLELVSTGVFMVDLTDVSDVEKVLQVHCASSLFPYTSRQIADITREGGFPPMMIGLVNFADLYEKRVTQNADGAVEAVVN